MPNQFTHTWTKKDVLFLENNFKTIPYKKLGSQLKRSYPSIQSKIRSLKLSKRINKYDLDSSFFQEWSEAMAYVLGFITADGNVQNKHNNYAIHIACDDFDVIEKIRSALKTCMPIRAKLRENKKISYSLRFSDKKIFYDLVRLGITPRKSLTVKPPQIPDIYIWDYIRGFFDGDGSVYRDKNNTLHTLFYSGSISLLQFLLCHIKPLLSKYHGNIMHIPQKRAYKIHFGHKNSEIILSKMYNKATIFMRRKYQIFLGI